MFLMYVIYNVYVYIWMERRMYDGCLDGERGVVGWNVQSDKKTATVILVNRISVINNKKIII